MSSQERVLHDVRDLRSRAQSLLFGLRGGSASPEDTSARLERLAEDLARCAHELETADTVQHQLVKALNAVAWEYDFSSDRWTYVAPEAERILGFAPEEWTNMQFWIDRLHPADRESAVNSCMACTKRGESHELVYRFLRKDGRAVWLRDVVFVELQDGKPRTLRGHMIDITEAQEAQLGLRERVKELQCVYGISRLAEEKDSLGEILQGAVDLIPQSWQYPEVARARIVFGADEYRTGSLCKDRCDRCTYDRISQDILVNGEPRGEVRVCYLETMPRHDEGPFLKEERDLIDAIAARLGHDAERFFLRESMRITERIVKQSPVVLFRWKAVDGWPVEYVSENVSQFGYPAEDFLSGKLRYDGIIHADDLQRVASEVQRHSAGTEEEFGQQYRIHDADGNVRWVDDHTTIKRDESGTPVALEGTIFDMTRRKRLSLAIHQEEEKYRTTLASIGDGVITTDTEGRVAELNPVAEALTGWLSSEARGKPLADVFHIINAKSRERVDNPVAKVLASGRIVGLANHTILVARDGSERQIADSAAPILSDAGDITGVVLVFRDVTEEYAAAEALKRSENDLRRAQHIAGVGSWRFDMNAGMVIPSEEARAIYGLGESEWAIPAVQVVPLPEYREMLDDALRALIEENKPYDVEFRIRRPSDGAVRYIHSVAEYDPETRVVVGTVQDLTDLKETEARLAESEDLLEATGRMARVGGWELDPETMEVTWTRETYRIHELPFTRKPPLEDAISFFHPEDRPILEEALRAALEEAKPYDLELRFRSAGGKDLVTHTMCTPIVENGIVVKLRGTFQDITDLHRMEEELSAIFDMSLAMICVADIESTNFLRVNPAFTTVLGYEREELVGQPFMKFIHPDDIEPTKRIVEEHLRKGEKVFSFENRYLHKDGSYRWLVWNSHPQPEQHKTYAVAIDITEQRRMQDRMRQMEKMDSIGQLAGGVAHDFNNQLAGIMGYAEMLTQRLDNPNCKRYAENIVIGATRAADLTKQLLAFSRKGKYENAPVNVHDTVHEVVEMLRHSVDKRIDIKQRLEAQSVIVQGDPSQIQNALLNLGINARDAMPQGGELVYATQDLDLSKEDCIRFPYDLNPGQYIKITIRDTGCGMPESIKKHIFEPFFTTKEPGKGTGMGLAAVYGTIKHHSGAINVYSEPGQGTTFTIYLPVMKRKPTDIIPKETDTSGLAGLRVLLVDDEAILREMASDLLKSLGCICHAEANGRDAVDYYRQHWQEIDIVLLDMVMPKLSGKDAWVAIREINPEAQVILVSGYSPSGDSERILAEGAAGFLQKPFQQSELATLLWNVIHPDAD